jgi:glutamyl/glutaminyl-tRNA synthetase
MTVPAITRFAPSPTGHLHVGGARTALFNWALAQRLGGHFLLRIEDTDQARNSQEAVRGILEDLAWLGIHWQEGPVHAGVGGDPRGVGPFFQSERLARYDAAVARLIERDLAYPAFETPEALEALRKAASAEKRAFRYVRDAGWDREAALARMAREPHVVRLRAPDETIRVQDQILGEVAFGPDQIDDFVIRKRDGFPTYHLAVVVDDEAMGVTHVLRGPEHLNNTPKHIALQRALGFGTPIYAHIPLIQNPDGSKMSKRDKDKAARSLALQAFSADAAKRAAAVKAVEPQRLAAWLADAKSQLETTEVDALEHALALELPSVTVEDFRHAGYLPETVTNYLALLGWNPGEKLADGRDRERLTLREIADKFSLERIGRGQAKFDRAKLLAFSQEQLAALADEDWLARWRVWCQRYAAEVAASGADPQRVLADPARARIFAASMKSRCGTLAAASAPLGPGRFALVADDAFAYDERAVAKWLEKGEPSGHAVLERVRATLADAAAFEPAALEAAVSSFCEASGLGMGKVAQPLRVALTGSAASPPLGETLAVLGRDAVLARIDRCLRETRPT